MVTADIQFELQIIIGLLTIVVLWQIFASICLLLQQKRRMDKKQWSELWYRDKLDELIVQAALALKERPNLSDALYFGAKALRAKGRYDEAHEYLERFLRIEPGLAKEMASDMEDLMSEINANKSVQGTREARPLDFDR